MLVRDLGHTLEALETRNFGTCSTGAQTVGGSTANELKDNGAGTTFYGRIIDRLGDFIAGARYQAAVPSAQLWSSKGSTEADGLLQLGIGLQHGDSSGGGDMVKYSTDQQPAVLSFGTTARSTDMSAWTTGELRLQTAPCVYDLRAAKRFIRVEVFARKNKATTESSGYEGSRLSASMTFLAADRIPAAAWTTQGSTSTST